MAKKKITDVVAELAGDFLAENGYELYNTEFVFFHYGNTSIISLNCFPHYPKPKSRTLISF